MRQNITIYVLIICALISGCKPVPTALPILTPTFPAFDIPVVPLAAGVGHTCAITSDGGVKCWGKNDHGQLGDGTTTDRLTPVDVIGLSSTVRAIAAGGYFTCALTADGAVKCWGDNHFSQLGDETTMERHTPTDVSGLGNGIQSITAGGRHACALTMDGAVKCWGKGCMLGDGSCNTSTKPINVISLSRGVVAVAAGDSHTCAITASGGAKCWGSNTFGGLGNGKQDDWENAPVDVTGLTSGVAAIAPGDSHTCALTIEGGVKCWGGLNSITFKVYVLPEDVATLTSGVRSIASGGDNTCAITTEGGVKCWGKDQFRTMLDDGTLPGALPTVTFSDNPHGYDIGLQSDIIAITVGRSHICVLTSYSAVKCRGWNYYGQLGDGTLEPRSTPVVILQR